MIYKWIIFHSDSFEATLLRMQSCSLGLTSLTFCTAGLHYCEVCCEGIHYNWSIVSLVEYPSCAVFPMHLIT